MLIARAYRHTEKLLLDNKDKLTLVSSLIMHFVQLSAFNCNFVLSFSTPLLCLHYKSWLVGSVFPVGQCAVRMRGSELRWHWSLAGSPTPWAQKDDRPAELVGGREGQTRHGRRRTSTTSPQTQRRGCGSTAGLILKCMSQSCFTTAALCGGDLGLGGFL